MSLLDERPLSPLELEARDMEPAPGWGAVSRDELNQDETDRRIRSELRCYLEVNERASLAELEEFDAIVGPSAHASDALGQLGGLDTDPMVRVLAVRAWGRRDIDERKVRELAESYRVALGLLPWKEHEEATRIHIESYRMSYGTFAPEMVRRRSGRTTRGLLYAFAKCVTDDIDRIAFQAQWPVESIRDMAIDLRARLLNADVPSAHLLPMPSMKDSRRAFGRFARAHADATNTYLYTDHS